jgi:hypothetical protein
MLSKKFIKTFKINFEVSEYLIDVDIITSEPVQNHNLDF